MDERRDPWIETDPSPGGWASKPKPSSTARSRPSAGPASSVGSHPDWRAMQDEQAWRSAFRKARGANPAFRALDEQASASLEAREASGAAPSWTQSRAKARARAARPRRGALAIASALSCAGVAAGTAWLGLARGAPWGQLPQAPDWTAPAVLACCAAAACSLGVQLWMAATDARARRRIPLAKDASSGRPARPRRAP